jgi:hypothetical protein
MKTATSLKALFVSAALLVAGCGNREKPPLQVDPSLKVADGVRIGDKFVTLGRIYIHTGFYLHEPDPSSDDCEINSRAELTVVGLDPSGFAQLSYDIPKELDASAVNPSCPYRLPNGQKVTLWASLPDIPDSAARRADTSINDLLPVTPAFLEERARVETLCARLESDLNSLKSQDVPLYLNYFLQGQGRPQLKGQHACIVMVGKFAARPGEYPFSMKSTGSSVYFVLITPQKLHYEDPANPNRQTTKIEMFSFEKDGYEVLKNRIEHEIREAVALKLPHIQLQSPEVSPFKKPTP